MKKEWFATSELVGVGGLPKSRQGLNKRAREDGWEKRRRKGVQGRGVEYSIHSLPETVRQSLLLDIEPSAYSARQPAALAVWMQIYQQLSEKERDELIAYILRVGVSTTLSQLGITPSDGDVASSMEIG
ncbi:putative DNA-binding transcriptional regulator [Pectobacterium parmentieri]|uniref:Cro/Cl family transcriptional regulator n=1 Tax=Pectobacterium parmentieri TaxID=1905730 RepID=A0A0H3I4M3_PECPM|nr:DNA-binding protein [Pectobacterium parmentieri]ACX86609.1 MuA-transposase/repressor protein CI DNA-binding protein [Pectobacterium parmentieri WPP163]AFI88815.1 MuA-transposase/repressor protein CI DNA-binding protein [Pectobacterium parmentieri]AOR60194.1 Cro/Cl family transcriptional regulator [Pectobacterium parmentieri]AYH04568.1 Cro/Cl family transcriptional regulator [Pectobacterium parmentieri]AYH08845.1 Cro/Cl family transcriptional regulator [Pectobacterium parmentieri]